MDNTGTLTLSPIAPAIVGLEHVRELARVNLDLIAEGSVSQKELALRAAAYMLSNRGKQEMISLMRTEENAFSRGFVPLRRF